MKLRRLGSLILAFSLSSAWVLGEEVPQLPVATRPAAMPLAEIAAGAQAPATDAARNACTAACGTSCANPRRFYGSADALVWWLQSAHLPPLVTTGDFADNPVGALGQPSTRVLFGDERVDADCFVGGRFTIGVQARCNPNLFYETTFFFLGQESASFDAQSPGTPGSRNLMRPFFNVDADLQDADVVALSSPFVAIREGRIDVDYAQRMWGFEFNAKSVRSSCCGREVYLLGGFRVLALDENLDIHEATRDLIGNRGTADLVSDSFATRNRFYGGQIGAGVDVKRGCWTVSVVGKLGLGATCREVILRGSTSSLNQATGETATFDSGLLVQASNRGEHDDSTFAVVPEFGINVARQITERLSVRAGYTFLYISDVARPADHVDLRVGVQALPPGPTGVQAPVFRHVRDDDFWAQGFNFGIEYKY
jgi:hypothetical protein